MVISDVVTYLFITVSSLFTIPDTAGMMVSKTNFPVLSLFTIRKNRNMTELHKILKIWPQ